MTDTDFVLLIDDIPDDVDLTILALKRSHLDCDVVVARNGFDMLKTLRAQSRTGSLPVVILTSSSEESDVVSGYSNGANSYIRKPVDFTNFTEVVKQLGMYWLILNQSVET